MTNETTNQETQIKSDKYGTLQSTADYDRLYNHLTKVKEMQPDKAHEWITRKYVIIESVSEAVQC